MHAVRRGKTRGDVGKRRGIPGALEQPRRGLQFVERRPVVPFRPQPVAPLVQDRSLDAGRVQGVNDLEGLAEHVKPLRVAHREVIGHAAQAVRPQRRLPRGSELVGGGQKECMQLFCVALDPGQPAETVVGAAHAPQIANGGR